MKKEMRFRDFQIHVWTTGNMDANGSISRPLFTFYEIVRLWLQERTIKAPFVKLVVDMTDEATIARVEGYVTNLFSICEVHIAVDYSTLPQNTMDLRWVCGRVLHALSYVKLITDWQSPELEEFLVATSEKELPLVHFFDRLARADRRSKTKCIPWVSLRSEVAQVGVRLSEKDGTERDVALVSELRPILLTDHFPFTKSALRGPDFVLLDKADNVLASVPIDEPGRARVAHQPRGRSARER